MNAFDKNNKILMKAIDKGECLILSSPVIQIYLVLFKLNMYGQDLIN